MKYFNKFLFASTVFLLVLLSSVLAFEGQVHRVDPMESDPVGYSNTVWNSVIGATYVRNFTFFTQGSSSVRVSDNGATQYLQINNFTVYNNITASVYAKIENLDNPTNRQIFLTAMTVTDDIVCRIGKRYNQDAWVYWNGASYAAASAGTSNTSWNKLEIRFQDGKCMYYLNNAFVANVSGGWTPPTSIPKIMLDANNANAGSYYFFDDFKIYEYSEVPTGTSGSVVLNSPTNNEAISEPTFSYTPSEPFNNCSLWHNVSGAWQRNSTDISITADTENEFVFPGSLGLSWPEGNYIWNVVCNNTFWANSNYTFILDRTKPNFIINNNNFFNISNQSTITDYSGLSPLQINITLNSSRADLQIFRINITNSNIVYYSYTNESLNNINEYNFSTTTDYSSWPRNVNYTIDLFGSDGINSANITYRWFLPEINQINNVIIRNNFNTSTYLLGQTLFGYANITLISDDINTVEYIWYKNDTIAKIENLTIDLESNSYSLINTYTNFTVGDRIKFGVRSFSTTFTTAFINSTEISISPFLLNLTLYNEETNTLIANPLSIIIETNVTQRNYTTSTGSILINLTELRTYTIKATGINFQVANHILIPNINQEQYDVKLYLTNSTTTVLFNVKDTATSIPLVVLVQQYRFINNVWTLIESKYSDVTGRVQFPYTSNIAYQFIFSADNYVTQSFVLDPVLFASYDIYMTRSSVINIPQNFDRITISYSPTEFYNNQQNNFSLTMISKYNEFSAFGYTLTYPTGTVSNTSFAAGGATISSTFTITNAIPTDRVKATIFYTVNATTKSYDYYFPINTLTSNLTMMENKNNHYGLGLFERMLVVTLLVILIAGVSTLVGQPILGTVIALFTFGYFASIGFIPLWSVLTACFIGVILISMRTQY